MLLPVLFLFASVSTHTTSAQVTGVGAVSGVNLVRHIPNPGGLQVGFFPNYRLSGEIVRDFGPRPIERTNFHKWYQYEVKPGIYEFGDAFEEGRRSHRAGATMLSNIDIMHSRTLNPDGMHALPDWYDDSITNTQTREAARRFLRAFTRQILTELGTVNLVIDYEFFWFSLPKTPKIREQYRDWFIEATQLCREVAAEMGMSDRLRLGIIVNSNPLDMAARLIGSPAEPGHVPQQWLLDCVRAADFIGIDTYAGGDYAEPGYALQLDVIRFWIKHYSLDLPVYVTESGFSSVQDHDPTSTGYHSRGTEVEQAEFFRGMLDTLTKAKQNPSDPLSRVEVYCIWNYRDWAGDENLLEKYFGITRDDGSPKPAFGVIRDAIRLIESDPQLAPTRLASREDITAVTLSGDPIAIERFAGNDFTALEIVIGPTDSGQQTWLEIATTEPASFIVGSHDVGWVTSWPDESTTSRLKLPKLDDSESRLLVVPTSGSYPFRTQIVGLTTEVSQGRKGSR